MLGKNDSKKTSPHAPAMFYDQLWPNVNSFGSRGHQIQNYRFSRRWFSSITFLMRDTKMKMTPSYLPRRAGSKHVLLGHERSISKYDLRTGHGQVKTQVGQYAYLPKRLDEPSRLAPFARLYLYPDATYWRKTDCDLIWPQVTSPCPRSSVAPGSAQMGWVVTILKELGGFGWSKRNRKHFHISP